MAVSDVGDRKSFQADDSESFDYQGYCLAPGADGDNHVAKTSSATDTFLGTNFISSEGNTNNREIRSGEPVPVEQDGWVNMLCLSGETYNVGDPVYLSQTAGIASTDADPAGDGSIDPTRVGTVMRHRDLTGDSSPKWVVVSITGRV